MIEVPETPLWHDMKSKCDGADRLRKELVWSDGDPNMEDPVILTKGHVDRLCNLMSSLAYSIMFHEEQRIKRAAYKEAGV